MATATFPTAAVLAKCTTAMEAWQGHPIEKFVPRDTSLFAFDPAWFTSYDVGRLKRLCDFVAKASEIGANTVTLDIDEMRILAMQPPATAEVTNPITDGFVVAARAIGISVRRT